MKIEDLPIIGKFVVIDVETKERLFTFGEEDTITPLEISSLDVVAFYAVEDKIYIEVMEGD